MPKISYPPYVHQDYPKVKYHETYDPITVENREEEQYLDSSEWKNSPADFGVITHPSKEQMMKARVGFNFEELKARKKAEKEAAIRKLANQEYEDEEEKSEEEEDENVEEDNDILGNPVTRPVAKKGKRK